MRLGPDKAGSNMPLGSPPIAKTMTPKPWYTGFLNNYSFYDYASRRDYLCLLHEVILTITMDLHRLGDAVEAVNY